MQIPRMAIAVVCSLVLAFAPICAAATQTASPAVVNTARQIFANTYNTVRSGDTGSGPWASASAAAKILFAHYNETGLTASEQTRILSNPAAFVNFQLDSMQVDALCTRLESEGINIPCPQIANLVNSTVEERKEAVNSIQREGLAAIDAQIVTMLQAAAKQGVVAAALTGRPQLRSAVLSRATCGGAGRLRPISITGDNCKRMKVALAVLAFTGEEEAVLILGLVCIAEGCC